MAGVADAGGIEARAQRALRLAEAFQVLRAQRGTVAGQDAPVDSEPLERQVPVKAQPPSLPCSTYGWIEVSLLLPGTQIRKVTTAPAGAFGVGTYTSCVPAVPLNLTLSEPPPL